MARLPTVGGDYGNWGTVLNEYLQTAHNADGTLKLDLQTIADLKAIDVATLTDKQQALVAGYYAPGDQGGGAFYYDAAASDADNGGTVIAPTAGAGRWKRAYSVEMSAAWFGALPHATEDRTALLQGAIDAAAGVASLYIPAGTYRAKNLLLRAGAILRGAGRSTVLKLTDDASGNWDFVIGTYLGGSYADIDNVIVRDLALDGNKSVLLENPTIAAKIGDGSCQMHGITIYGEHDGYLVENIHSQNTGGDGVMVTAAASGTKIPTNIRIVNCTQSGCGRQDIAVVNVSGCTITGCSGDGTFDVEANSSAETCERLVISDCRYGMIFVSTLTAEENTVGDDAVVCSNMNADTRMVLWGVAGGAFSNLRCGGLIEITECYNCTVTNVIAASVKVSAPNGRFVRRCAFSNLTATGADATLDYGLFFYNASGCYVSDARIVVTNASSDGIRITNNDDPTTNENVFDRVSIEAHTRYGVYVVNGAALANTTNRFVDLDVRQAGTYPIYYTSGSATCYGRLIIERGRVVGSPQFSRPLELIISGLEVIGNYNIGLQISTSGWTTRLEDILFKRVTAGTPTISVNGSTDVAGLYIGRVRQAFSGGWSIFGTITFASGVKAWIDGPTVEATTWADSLGTNVTAGSMYRLRGNTTNWGYTHNGTSWMAKAH